MKNDSQRQLYFLFFFTGISGLIYQVLWVRLFGLVFGNTIYASSTVLAAFMGGLALGSFLAGHYVSNRYDGLKIYSIMELCVGIFGILVPIIIKGLDIFYVWFYRGFNPSFEQITLLRFVISFVVLIIPCTFMGATLPVISKYITDRKKEINGVIGKLYGINTIGAVVGCFVTGFFLIKLLGLTLSSVFAAILNIAVAFCALYIFKKQKDENIPNENSESEQVLEENNTNLLHKWVILISYGLSGFGALALEVAWTRSLVWVTGMDTYAYSSMLTVILAGIGIGSLIYSVVEKKIKNDLSFLYIVQFLVGASIILSIYTIQHSFDFNSMIEMGVNNSSVLKTIFKAVGAYTITNILVSSYIFLIPSILMGISFPLFSKIYIRINKNVGRGIGNIYSINTFGSILGSVLMGFVIVPLIGTLPAIALMGGIYFCIAFLLLVISNDRKTKRIAVGMTMFFTACILMATANTDFTTFLGKTLKSEQLRADEKLIYFKEHATGGVMIKESKYYGREMMIDGVQVASTGDHDLHSHLYPAHLMSLLKKDPKTALIVAFGCGGTSGSMLRYNDVERLDVVEICDGVIEPAKKYFSTMNSNVFGNPKLNLIIQDGKNYVKMTDKTYDIVYSGPIHPQSNQGSAGLYTKEFFEDCKKRLSKGGFQCLWLPLHMSSAEDFKAIVKTFMEVYPHVTMWQLPQTDFSASHPHLIGSNEEILPDYEVVAEKLKRQGIAEDLARLNDTSFKEPYEFLSQFAMSKENLKKFVGDAKLNTDDHPVVEFYDRPMNLQIASKLAKSYLIVDILKYMENPYPYIKNVPPDKKDELKKQLDRLYEGNKSLLQGHYFLTAKNFLMMDLDEAISGHYANAYKLIPESTYLKKYFEGK